MKIIVVVLIFIFGTYQSSHSQNPVFLGLQWGEKYNEVLAKLKSEYPENSFTPLTEIGNIGTLRMSGYIAEFRGECGFFFSDGTWDSSHCGLNVNDKRLFIEQFKNKYGQPSHSTKSADKKIYKGKSYEDGYSYYFEWVNIQTKTKISVLYSDSEDLLLLKYDFIDQSAFNKKF